MEEEDALEMVCENNFIYRLPVGDQMADLFSVYINKTADCDTINLYGTIKITTGLFTGFIYKRERSDYESIGTGATSMLTRAGLLQWIKDKGEMCILTLTGPFPCVLAEDSFDIEVDLWDCKTDTKVYEGFWFWCSLTYESRFNGVRRTRTLEGKYGPLVMHFAVFDEAMQATVEVTLIDHDGEERADVFGVLATQDHRFPFHENVLFQREPDKHITVRSGARIPLSRSSVVVPLESELTVMADLCDNSSISQIVKGTAEFKPQLSGTFTENITGEGWEIEVKVVWISLFRTQRS